MKTNNYYLLTGGILNFLLALGHLICLKWLKPLFKLYRISNTMDQYSAHYGAATPYIITIIIALCFCACGIYALSACGIIPKLPLLKIGIFTIALIFLLRVAWGIFQMLTHFKMLEISSSLIAATIGICYLTGGIQAFCKSRQKATVAHA